MTTYKNTNYETTEALREALNTELSAIAYPYAVRHKTYGEGQLTFIKAPLTGGSLYATVDFAVGTKTLAMDVVLSNNFLEMPEILLDIILEAQTAFKEDFETHQQELKELERRRREQALEAKKKKEEEIKKEAEKQKSSKVKGNKESE